MAAGSAMAGALQAQAKLRVGLIGAGGRGRYVAKTFLNNPDVTFGAVCDVYEPNLEKGLSETGNQGRAYRNYKAGQYKDARNEYEELLRKSLLLGEHPRLGRMLREPKRDALRELIVRPYRLIYQIDDPASTVKVRVLWHGASQEPELT